MKKIGIVTWFISYNYGTNLQAYALYKVLKQLNYDAKMILPEDNCNNSLKKKVIFLLSKTGIKNLIIRLNFLGYQRAKLNKFINNNLNIVTVRTSKQYKKLLNEFPVFITGSDQIWNPSYVSPFLLLDFAGDNKRIAYASSLGVSSIPEDIKYLYKKYLSKFNHISLREKTGCDIIKNLLPEQNVQQMMDPTFLLDKNEWASFANNAKIEFHLPHRYLLVYLIGNNDFYKEYVSELKKTLPNAEIIVIKSVENGQLHITGAIHYKFCGPKEFIKLIINSQCVCTDSFHACALSINLSKQFYALKRFQDTDNSSQNSRLYNLLEHYKLSDRILETKTIPLTQIEYSNIQATIKSERQNCINYLVNSIEN